MSEPKGYVVRGKDHDGDAWAAQANASANGWRTYTDATERRDAATLYASADEAAGAAADFRERFADVTILAVAEDGTETPLPSYEEALAELDHLRTHVAALPIALAPVPLGDVRPAVMGGKGIECRECRARPPYHEATCSRRTAGDERLAWARYVDAAIDNMEATIAEERGEFRADTWHARTRAALDDAAKALRDLGVDVDALLEAADREARTK